MTKQDKLNRIYEVIAEKYQVDIEGCQAFSDICWKKDDEWKFLCNYCRQWKWQDRFEERNKPVMIGDCLDWNDKQQTWLDWKDKADWRMVNSHLCMLWEYKRLPIDEQSDKCIDYIYSLIK